MNAATDRLNQRLIVSAYKAIEAWEEWVAAGLPEPWKTFNVSCIRLTKGIVKAWRLLLVELKSQSEPTPKLASGEAQPQASLNHRMEGM